MRVCITGSSGLIGSTVVRRLAAVGWNVIGLQRATTKAAGNYWNPATGEVRADVVSGSDAVIHLAGENIAGGRWTAARKERIRSSRVDGTRRLCQALVDLDQPPPVLICASATGFYGDRGDQVLDESSEAGHGFLANVCRDWEGATEPAGAAGIRVVNLRFGIVLSSQGGALAKMLTPLRMGLGGPVGRGDQFWSWISVDDAAGAIHHSVVTSSLQGPVNAVSPQPVTNREFTAALGHVLRRPALLRLPALAARALLGEMADQLLLASTRVLPARLQESEYGFQHPTLEEALRHVLDGPE